MAWYWELVTWPWLISGRWRHIHVPRVRKVSFAGGKVDECVARQKWVSTVIDSRVQHHYFKSPPISKEGCLLGLGHALPLWCCYDSPLPCSGSHTDMVSVLPSWAKSVPLLGRQQAPRARKKHRAWILHMQSMPPSWWRVWWLLSVWLWKSNFVDLMRGGTS